MNQESPDIALNDLPDSVPSRSTLTWQDVLLTTPTLTRSQWLQLSSMLKWLVMIRAPVLIMTICSVVVGVLLAASTGEFYADRLVALLVGLSLAHACNNLLNDWIDSARGVDGHNYFRTRYGTQVIEAGFVSKREFMFVVLLTVLPALLAAGYLVWICGTKIIYLTLGGAFFLVFYTWPLKHWALGELAVLLVWGPMITAGSYFVMTAGITEDVLLISLIYGIGPTLVILGKHIDKCAEDQSKGIGTLPVLIGEPPARYLSIVMLVAQWMLLVSVIYRLEEYYPLLICLLGAPAGVAMILKFSTPRPAEKPSDYAETVWPLWYSAHAFIYSRYFGLLLIAALGGKLLLGLVT